ncbi:MAG: T9SS type A sorting domain-containing protein [Bacteroidota bacterium]
MKTQFFIYIALCFLTAKINCQTKDVKNDLNESNFKNIQKKFNDWKKNRNLKNEKGWKNFKRWENEIQMHCDAKGEPCNANEYLNACINSSIAKEQNSLNKLNSGTWYPAGPNVLPNNLTGYMNNGIGRVNCVAFDPVSNNTFYVGVAQGGLWKTTDNGQTYIPLTDNLPITRISDICIDPSNPNSIYISLCDFEYIGFGLFLNGRKRNTHYGLGVYHSNDGGNTWSPTGLSFQLSDGDASLIREIVIDPNNSNKLVACGVSGMYKTIDGGQNWTKVLDSLFWDLQQDPVFPNTLYAAGGWVKNSNTGHAAIYKSTDFGSTWTMLNTGIPTQGAIQRIRIGIAPTDNNYIYAITTDVQNGMYGIYKSTDAGITWNLHYNSLNLLEWGDGLGTGGQGTYDLGFLIDPNNKDVVYVGGVNLWKSSDGATTFEPCGHWTTSYGPSNHADIHYIAYQPLTGYFYVADDGGLWRTNSIISQSWNAANGGNPWPTQWTSLNDGIQTTSFYRLSSSKRTSGELIAGAQDNASFYFDGTNWSTVNGGDGMDNLMDTSVAGTFICSSQYGSFASTTDGGVNFNYINPNVNSENGEWTTPIVADYNNYGKLLSGFGNVTLSIDNGLTWSAISNFPMDPFYQNEISALAISNSNTNVIYAARRVRYEYSIPGSLWKTSDGGQTWSDVTVGLPDSLYFTAVEINRSNENEVYITMAGFSSGNKVFKTTDGGITWMNISYNLPNIPINCIKNVPGTNSIILGTDIGVWKLEAGANNWTSYSIGLPNVIVSDIEFNTSLNKIYVSTFGRGIWATDLDIFVTAKQDPKGIVKLKLYPSINNGEFTIELENFSNELKNIEIEVIDLKGKVKSIKQFESKNKIEIKENLSPGLYFARIRSGELFEVKKFIVQ